MADVQTPPDEPPTSTGPQVAGLHREAGRPEAGADRRGADEGVGGEPAGTAVCWLERVCPECGGLSDGPPATVCPRCGTPRP